MEEHAVVLMDQVNLMSQPMKNATYLTRIDKGSTVLVLEKEDKLWWKVQYDDYIGYIKSKFLKSESANDDYIDIMISLPRDCAIALYDALRFSLK